MLAPIDNMSMKGNATKTALHGMRSPATPTAERTLLEKVFGMVSPGEDDDGNAASIAAGHRRTAGGAVGPVDADRKRPVGLRGHLRGPDAQGSAGGELQGGEDGVAGADRAGEGERGALMDPMLSPTP